jgi:DNA helicase-2/ATP-dependent DNA helicase PcrA
MTGWLSDDRLAIHNLIQRVQGVELQSKSSGQTRLTPSAKNLSDMELQPDEAMALCRHVPVDVLDASREDMDELRKTIERHATEASTYPLSNLNVTDAFVDKFCRGRIRAMTNLNRWYDSRTDREALENALRRYDQPVPRERVENTGVQTIHASKGSQAEQVILYDGVTKRIYDDLLDDADSKKNEWRTWYVGMTRAQDSLIVLKNAWTNAYDVLPDDLHRYAQAAQPANAQESTGD